MNGKTDRKDAGVSENARKDHEGYISGQNCAQSPLILGEHKITEFRGLLVLKKPPLEDYVSGTRKKKLRKRKPKCKKYYSSTCDSFIETNEKLQMKDENLRDSPLKTETLEEKLLNEKIDRTVRNNIRWMKQEDKKNHRKQRLLEKEAMEELKNLAETWLGSVQRKKEQRLKAVEDLSSVSCGSQDNYRNYRPTEISLVSKKVGNDEKDKKINVENWLINQREEEQIHKPSSAFLDLLENDFLEKLVFIDVSGDEQDCV